MIYSKKVISKRNSSKKNPRKKNRRNTKINKKIVSKKKFFGGSAVSKQYTVIDIFESHEWTEDSMRQPLPHPHFHTYHPKFQPNNTSGSRDWYFNIHIENFLNEPDNYPPVKITEQHLVYFSNFLYLPRIHYFLGKTELFSQLFKNDTFKNIINFITFTKLLEQYFRKLTPLNSTHVAIGDVRDIVQNCMMRMLENLKNTDIRNDIGKETNDMLTNIQDYIKLQTIGEIGLISSLNNELAKNTIFDNTIIQFYKTQMKTMGFPIENTNYTTREEKEEKERKDKEEMEAQEKKVIDEKWQTMKNKEQGEGTKVEVIDRNSEEEQLISTIQASTDLVVKYDFKTRKFVLGFDKKVKKLEPPLLDKLCELQREIKIKTQQKVELETFLTEIGYNYNIIRKEDNYTIFKISKK